MYQGRRRAERGAKLVGIVVENNRRDPRSGGFEVAGCGATVSHPETEYFPLSLAE